MSFKYLFLLFALSFSVNSYSLERKDNRFGLILTGPIEKGDYNKFLELVGNDKSIDKTGIVITSNGGDVLEAIKIGDFIRKTGMSVTVRDKCLSACFFIWAAGVNRYMHTDSIIGIHRPFFEKHYFAGLSLMDADKLYASMQDGARRYLLRMGIPNKLIEKMFATPSDRMYLVEGNDRDEIFSTSPAFSEWIRSKCNMLTAAEEKDFSPNDRWLKETEKKYSSIGYFDYLSKKYTAYEKCVEKLVIESKIHALDKGKEN